jgi:DNA modification methylase
VKIILKQIDQIRPYPNNARKITEKAIEKVATSIKSFGWRQPIVVAEDGVIVIGHVRHLAAIQLGLTQVPVHVVENLTPSQIRQLRLMDNRSHEETEFDFDILQAEMVELKDIGVDLNLTGFDSWEIDKLLLAKDDAADDVPPVPISPVSRPGNVWLLGEGKRQHRIVCGDCRDPQIVERVCGATKPILLWTDAPYGLLYVGKTKEALTIQNDDREGLHDLLHQAFLAASKVIAAGSPFYLASPAGPALYTFEGVVNEVGWKLRQHLIWVKDSMVLSHADYHFKHETILYGFLPGEGRRGRGSRSSSNWYGDNSQTTVLEFARPKRSTEHPVMKPTALVERCLSNSSPRGGIVLDIFCGSGSTLIAAEKSGRTCFGVEIDARYVDVICQRYEEFTGQPAILEATGATFAEIKAGNRGRNQRKNSGTNVPVS